MRQLSWQYKDKHICSGLMDFDNAIDGYEGGKLIVIAAPPAVGEKELIISIITGLAVNNSVPVGVFSLEMPNIMVIRNILINVFEINQKNMEDCSDSCSTEMLKKLNDAPIYLDDTSSIDIKTLKEGIINLSSGNIKIIFIDNLQLIKDYKENERFILDEIKRVAEKFQVTIIGSFGIKRMYQNYPICNPDIHKRINNLLQYADIVAMLNRPGYYSPTIAKNLPDLVTMHFLKNTYSQTNSLDFTCNSRICKMFI